MGRLSISGDRTLLSAGHTPHGCDVVPAQQDRFPKEGGVPGSIASAAPSLVVLNAVQTEAVRFGDPGLVPLPKPGAVVLACATVAPDLARDVARRGEAAGLHKLDAPISAGGSAMKGQPDPRRCPHRRDGRALTSGMTQGIAPRAVSSRSPRSASAPPGCWKTAPHIVEGDYAPGSSVRPSPLPCSSSSPPAPASAATTILPSPRFTAQRRPDLPVVS
jgi:hypothetical protein